jgi:hypothetical protein
MSPTSKRNSQALGVQMFKQEEICYKREGEKDNSSRDCGDSERHDHGQL